MSKETTRRARLEPRTSRSRVGGVNRSATHTSTRVKEVSGQIFSADGKFVRVNVASLSLTRVKLLDIVY